MLTLLIVLQVLVAIFLILVVLLQPGNKGGMSAAFGGAGGETVFGGRGANTFLAKLTFGAAALFIVTSVSLSFLSLPPKSIVQEALRQDAAVAPNNSGNPGNDGVVPPANDQKEPSESSPNPTEQ